MILAAGKGERMAPLTEGIQKALISCVGMTLIDRLVSVLRTEEIDNFTIGVGWKATEMDRHFDNHPETDVIDIVHVPEYERGPLQTLVTALDVVHDEQFIVCPADLFVEGGVVSLTMSEHVTDNPPRIASIAVDKSDRTGTPVYVKDTGQVAGLGRAVQDCSESGHSAMVLAVDRRFISYCKEALDSGKSRVVDALNLAISIGEDIRQVDVTGRWFDVDDIKSLLDVNEYLLRFSTPEIDGSIFVPAGDTMDIGETITLPSGIVLESGVQIVGPSFIAPECKVGSHCVIGPIVSLEMKALVKSRSKVRNSLLLREAQVGEGTNLTDSVVHGSDVFQKGK
ncbi:MAG: NTP transferase domain-containing protein [Candidatus Thorarchaeota archaeon]